MSICKMFKKLQIVSNVKIMLLEKYTGLIALSHIDIRLSHLVFGGSLSLPVEEEAVQAQQQKREQDKLLPNSKEEAQRSLVLPLVSSASSLHRLLLIP